MTHRPLLTLLTLLLLGGCESRDSYPIVGTLERDRIVLTAELAEPIATIDVREGDRVEAGVRLLAQDAARAQAELDRLSAARERVQRRLDELLRGPRPELIAAERARLEAAESAVTLASRELERLKRLRERMAASESELDAARTEWDTAVGRRDAARAALEELLEGTTVEELDQARAALAEAEAAVRGQRITLQRLEVHSPRASVVEALPFELGETPRAGATLAVLRATDVPPYARVYIPASLRARMASGTRVRVWVDGAGEFVGQVRFVASEAAFTPYFSLTEHDADRLSYLAEIDIEDGAELPSGVPVRVAAPIREE